MLDIEHTDADIFSRGSLTLTFEILRHNNASLALRIRNIIGGKALPKTAAAADSKHADRFRVSLDAQQVRAVVEALAIHCRAQPDGQRSGNHIMANALLDDWLTLARKMLAQKTQAPDNLHPPK